MILNMTKDDLTAVRLSVNAIIKAAEPKRAAMKPNSSEYAVLTANMEIANKIDYAGDLLNKWESLGSERKEVELELNRPQAKVLIATLIHTSAIQAKVMGEYQKRPITHEAFAEEPGRRKEDYVKRLGDRMEELNKVMFKIRDAL